MVFDPLKEYLSSRALDLIDDKEMKIFRREYEPACYIKRNQTSKNPVYFKIDGSPFTLVSNIFNDRKAISSLLSRKESTQEAYNIISKFNESVDFTVEQFNWSTYETTTNIDILPWIKFYEKDGGHYLTSAIVVGCLDNGKCNASIHRIMRTSDNKVLIRLVPRHLYKMVKTAVDKGESLPVTIILGVHPLHIVASATSPPMGIYELAHASRILSRNLMSSPIHNHPIPIANIVIEAEITPELGEEGPFVDAMGTYDRIRKQHTVEIKKIFYMPNSYVHIILPGGIEHALLMGFPREAAIYNSVSQVVPKVHKVVLTQASGGWLHAIISISKNTDGDAKNAILAAFAGHPSLKHVVIVDEDIDPDNPWEVEWAIATRFQGDRDLVIINNARGSTLDPSARDGVTTKIGIDATKPIDGNEIFDRAKIPNCN